MLVIKTIQKEVEQATQKTSEKKFHKTYYSMIEITVQWLFCSGRTRANSDHWWRTLEGESVRVDLREG
jgi:hypothetical protein